MKAQRAVAVGAAKLRTVFYDLRACSQPNTPPQGGPPVVRQVMVRVFKVDLDADTDRTGVVDETDSEEEVETQGLGAVILINNDDDDGDKRPDNDDADPKFVTDDADNRTNGAEDLNDLGLLLLRQMPGLPDGYELVLKADPDRVRIFDQDNKLVLGWPPATDIKCPLRTSKPTTCATKWKG